jgi:hypothetical protein
MAGNAAGQQQLPDIASLKGLETEMDRAGCLSYNSYYYRT